MRDLCHEGHLVKKLCQIKHVELIVVLTPYDKGAAKSSFFFLLAFRLNTANAKAERIKTV